MIRTVLIRNFRSVERSGLYGCGSLNIVIGKNNAGKSNVLSAIELMIDHLAKQAIAASWKVDRPADFFTHRHTAHSADIAVEFDLDEDVNETVRGLILADSPHLERAISELKGERSISFLLSAVFDLRAPFLFLRQIATGAPTFVDGEIHMPGMTLLKVPAEVAAELHANQLALVEVQSDQKLIDQVLAGSPEFRPYIENRQNSELPFRYLLDRVGQGRPRSSKYMTRLENVFKAATSYDEFVGLMSEISIEIKERLNEAQRRETTGNFRVFSGETKRQPTHVTELMAAVGSTSVLRLKESKQPIGPKEAEALLQLKIRRGGEKKLQLVRETVNALLGVSVDAFQTEKSSRASAADQSRAEIDVDDFLVEVNGAGVREALRIVLDLELNEPELVLIEEPEAHLHPGLARAIQHYLRDKSDSAQIFVTTHSTEFVDASSFQNVYLVARSRESTSVCSAITSHEEGLRIPAELGLRPSSLFMYDRLVFVEGSSDEEVFREIATKANVDFAKANVGFVHMGGVRNFAYFATEATLTFLTRRQVELLFVVDRDEREDNEVRKLVDQLRGRGHLIVLSRREIENFLLDPNAVRTLIESKLGRDERAWREPIFVRPFSVKHLTYLMKRSDSV